MSTKEDSTLGFLRESSPLDSIRASFATERNGAQISILFSPSAFRWWSQPARWFDPRWSLVNCMPSNWRVWCSMKRITQWAARPISTDLDRSRPISTDLDRSRPISTDLDRSRPISTDLDRSRPISTDLDRSRPISTDLDRSRPISTDLDRSRPISTDLDRSRPISTDLDRSRPISTASKSFHPFSSSGGGCWLDLGWPLQCSGYSA